MRLAALALHSAHRCWPWRVAVGVPSRMLPCMAGILAAAQILVLARRWFLHMKHQQVGLHTIVPTSARPDERSPSLTIQRIAHWIWSNKAAILPDRRRNVVVPLPTSHWRRPYSKSERSSWRIDLSSSAQLERVARYFG